MGRVLLVASYGRSFVEMRGHLIRSLRAAGHEVTVAAPFEDTGAPAALATIGAEFYRLDVDRGGINPLRDLSYAVRIALCMTRVRPDVILAISSKPVVYAGIVARLFPSAVVCSIISGLGYVFTGRRPKQRALATVTRLLYRIALKRSHVVFFQNDDDRAQFSEWGLLQSPGHAAVTNGDGIDLEHFGVRPLPGKGHFLLIGRLLTDKGILEYVAAARLVRKQHPGARFRLVGWFDESNPNSISRDTVAAWTQDGTIEFLGFQSDIRPILEDTDVYVLPSYREGLSRTTCEAMAMGRPIVSTDAPGCRQTVVEGQNGYLVPVQDPAALAVALSRFLEDPTLAARLGRTSRTLAVDLYDEREVNALLVKRMFDGDKSRTSGAE